ncbi:MAG: hypothetical protein PHG06_01110 [Parabacteroides sp.]|nr:hypothetical protein [Parabacteroides sp.]
MKVTNKQFRIYFTILSLFAVVCLQAQNVMTSSPYSMFGIGEIDEGLYGYNAGMGGVAYGMRGNELINVTNPAALTALDSMHLFFEASSFLKWENYKSKGDGNNAFTGNLGHFSLGARMYKRWYVAVGLSPYSSVGYYFKSTEPLEGSPGSYYSSTFEGDGGFSKVRLSNAFCLLPSLSLGINVNYVFGNITETETQGVMYEKQKLTGRTFTLDGGIQYQRRLGRDLSLTVGAVYGLPQTLSLGRSKTIYATSSSTSSSTSSTATTATDYPMNDLKEKLPLFIGAGASFQYKQWTYALDYLFQKYSTLVSNDSRITFNDTHSLKLGTTYYPAKYSSEHFWKRTQYKFGLDISTPYMHVNSQSGYSYRITAGMGFPVLNGRINLSLFYDQLKLNKNALQRNWTGITITYTLSELMYRVKL